MTRILIAEKQTLHRQMLRIVLNSDPNFTVVAEAADGSDALAKLQLCKVDSLIMNMTLPGLSGLDLITRAKALNPKLTILACSTNSDDQLITQALKNGAEGYISTMHELNDFLRALRKVTCGGRYIDPIIAESMMLHSITGHDEPVYSRLSQRELEIFRLLVSGSSINQIAAQLIISSKTVSSHKKKLMEKMHFSGMADLMRYAVQRRLFDDNPMAH
jgi:DNA-binding NarL/FixJ family response regulator